MRHTYGAERVALVATVSTLQLRSAVREAGKAYGLDEAQLRPLLKDLPHGWHPTPARNAHVGRHPGPVQRSATTGNSPCGIRHRGPAAPSERPPWRRGHHPRPADRHPAGAVVAQGLPHHAVRSSGRGGARPAQTRSVGHPRAHGAGGRRRPGAPGSRSRPSRSAAIPPDDARTGALLARGDTVGVFQCESEGARRTLRQLNARTVRDLAVANAFFKPGPASGGLADAFVQRYRGAGAGALPASGPGTDPGPHNGCAALPGANLARGGGDRRA